MMRWRHVTLAGEDGHLVSGWVPADVAPHVGATLMLTPAAEVYTVLEPFGPSVVEVPAHSRLPRWLEATPLRTAVADVAGEVDDN